MKYDFTTLLNRKGHDALALDVLPIKDVEVDPNFSTIPMWVADMNYPVFENIQKQMIERINEPHFGYFEMPEDYYKAIQFWQKETHGIDVEKEAIGYENGVLGILSSALEAFSASGEPILVQSPCYIGFIHTLNNLGRKIIDSPLKKADNWAMDYEDIEKKIIKHNIHFAIFCSPHNPTGRVWKKEELKRLFEICRAHQVYIISDEIHQDLVFGENKHIPSLSTGEYDDIMVSIVAASKTFNIAGAQNSMVIIPDEKLQEKWDAYVKGNRVLGGNAFGYVAAQAAYTGGNEWLTLVLDQIEENYQYLKAELAEKLPEAVVTPLEGTYLCWINLEAYVRADEMKEVIQKKCRLAVDFGDWFGGERFGTFIRMNLATSKENVEIGVNALIANLVRK